MTGRAARLACLLLVVLFVAPESRAQGTRDQRVAAADAAWGNLDYARAQSLLTQALDPRAGPTDSTWSKGVQLLGQVLLDVTKPGLAGIWLRWGFRLKPDLPIDSLTFTPDLVAAALAARNAVGGVSRGDSVTRTSWDWPAAATNDSMGRIRIGPTSLSSPVRLLIQGPRVTRGAGVGEQLSIPAGTYEIQAAADGYFTARVSREVLPGVTTVLGFDLRPVAVAAAPPRDTVRADTIARVVVAPPRDTVRADTVRPVPVVPRRDSVRADTVVSLAAVPAANEPPPAVTPEAVPRTEPPKTVAPPPVVRRGKSKLPFIVGGGAAAAGVTVYLLLSKPPTVETGSITGTIPVNPPGSD